MVPQCTAVQCGSRRGRHQTLVFVAGGLEGQRANVKQTAHNGRPHLNGWNFEKRLARAHLSQKLEHRRPSLSRNFGGRHGQRFAAPRVVRNTGGGLVVEAQIGELRVVQGAGDEVARDRDRDVFVADL